jgi:hypothetical protein
MSGAAGGLAALLRSTGNYTVNRFVTQLAVVAGLLAAAPAFAHGSHTGDEQPSMPAPSNPKVHHEARELQDKVNELNKDIKQDNKKLTMDQQKLQVLEVQAAEAKVGKAPPLSPDQQRELKELQKRIGNVNHDIGRDNEHLAADQAKLNACREQEAP